MYERILVPVDGSATSDRGLAEAIELARRLGARLRLVHVVDELSMALAMDAYSGYAGDWIQVLRDAGRKVLDENLAEVKAAGLEAEGCLPDTFSGSVQDLILGEARRWDAGLIVIGTHGRRGAKRWVLGSTAENILRQSPIPVLLVRAAAQEGEAHAGEGQAPAKATLTTSQPSQALAIE